LDRAAALAALATSPQVTVVAGSVMLDHSAVTVAEGTNGATTSAGLHVVLGALSAVDVTVHVKVTGGSATAGTDTSTLDMDITIPAGQTSAAVPFNVLGDDVVEGDETAQITLTAISGATDVEFGMPNHSSNPWFVGKRPSVEPRCHLPNCAVA
jgi:hypothetical protein